MGTQRKKKKGGKGKKQAQQRSAGKGIKQESGVGKTVKLIVVVILILGILGGAGYCTWRYWLKDYIAAGKTFTVEIDGNVYGTCLL